MQLAASCQKKAHPVELDLVSQVMPTINVVVHFSLELKYQTKQSALYPKVLSFL